MWTANVNVEDESAFGSAPVQAAHLGDEVVFVGRDRKEIRALSFDANVKNGWVSRALSFVAEHLLLTQVQEVHFAARPDPMLFALVGDPLTTGTIMACVYDRAENVGAWWRLDLGGVVRTCCVVETTAGAELWAVVTRVFVPGGMTGLRIVRVPLHEEGLVYLDNSTTGVVPVGGVVPCTVFPSNSIVQVVVDGAFRGDFTLSGFNLVLDAEDEGLTYTVGLSYSATLVQLPLEGGLQAGSSQGAKRRRTKVKLRLNNSALPLVNGKRPAERAPADPMDTGTDLVTGDVELNVLGWEEDGALTITQDVPFRTEILAIFGSAQVNEV